jgi:hypothetical protein
MSKHKHNKELERLRKLYGNTPATQAAEPSIPQAALTPDTSSASKAVVVHEHQYVRSDMLHFVVIAAICFALLIGINLLADNTSFGHVLLNVFGGLV